MSVDSTSKRPSVQALIFDLDGVITDTAEFHYLAWKRLADELGIAFDREKNQRLRGIGRMESLDIILEAAASPVDDGEKARLASVKNEYYKELILGITPEDMLPGMQELLTAARELGIRCALASASANAPMILEKLGITAYFDYVVNPLSLTRGKPDPEIFREAARGICVESSKCIGIEDAHAGIEAIKGAGMFAIGIGAHLQDAPCDWLVHTTKELSIDRILSRFEPTVA